MYQRAIFLLCLCFLVGCAQVDNDRQTKTVQSSETPTRIPTTTSTTTPTFTPSPSLTPTITPTPTEVPPPLPPGAAAVLKEDSIWVAYDSENKEVAVWLPDPDTGEEDWSQRYVKNQEGDIFRWDVPGIEWHKVPERRGAVDGWMDLEGKYPVWKIDISSLHEEGDPDKFVYVGEFNEKWDTDPFEVLLPDRIIRSIVEGYPFPKVSAYVDSRRNGGVVLNYSNNTVLLGLKYKEDDNGKKELFALVGDPLGIVQTQVDYFNVRDRSHVFVEDMEFSDVALLMEAFKRASAIIAQQEGSRVNAYFSMGILSPAEGTSTEEGCTIDIGWRNRFFNDCMRLEKESRIIRSTNEFELAQIIKSTWKNPDGYPEGTDWWAVAPEIPEGYIGQIGFIYRE